MPIADTYPPGSPGSKQALALMRRGETRYSAVQADQLDETVRAVVARHLAVSEAALTDDVALEPLGLDDRAAASVLGAVGDELDMRFPDDFFDGVHTYAQLTSAVRLAVGV